jgi:uncharacterized protein (DUF433 family)
MSSDLEFLTTTEAAVVAGVDVRDVNRLIDEHILPEELYRNDDTRRILAGACALVRFYFASAKSLTADERKFAIRHVWHDRARTGDDWTIARWRHLRPKWTYRHDHYLTLNFDPFIDDTLAEHEKLARARAIIVEDPRILGGTPVIKGTRVPAYDVAASAAKGLSIAEIRADFPSLTEDKIASAILYARATPQRGRPKASGKPANRATISRKVYARRSA